MPQLRIDPEEVQDIAAKIDTQHSAIKDVLTNLRAINAELDTVWDGESQMVFEDTYGNWIQQLDSYSETLTNVKGYLNSVAENFRALDDAAKQAASGATMAQ